jgi:hypothetical protein
MRYRCPNERGSLARVVADRLRGWNRDRTLRRKNIGVSITFFKIVENSIFVSPCGVSSAAQVDLARFRWVLPSPSLSCVFP